MNGSFTRITCKHSPRGAPIRQAPLKQNKQVHTLQIHSQWLPSSFHFSRASRARALLIAYRQMAHQGRKGSAATKGCVKKSCNHAKCIRIHAALIKLHSSVRGELLGGRVSGPRGCCRLRFGCLVPLRQDPGVEALALLVHQRV